MGVQVTPSPE
jgi:hypothetical protein